MEDFLSFLAQSGWALELGQGCVSKEGVQPASCGRWGKGAEGEELVIGAI